MPKRKPATSGGVEGMLEVIWARKVERGEPCSQGACGRTEGVRRPDGTRGACPTCERQAVAWAAWCATWPTQ